MPNFSYEASSEQGSVIKGTFVADSQQGVVDFLVKRNLVPLAIEEESPQSDGRGLSLALFQRFTTVDRILMMRNLAATVKAGVNLVEALDIMIVDTTKSKPREILIHAKTNVENGRPLSDTFEKYKKHFPPIFPGMIRAAEASGELDQTLDELAQYLAKTYSLTRKVKSALTYPILLVGGTFGVVALLIIVVIPKISKVFTQSGIKLPFITKALLAISDIMVKNPILDVVGLAFVIWFVTHFRKTKLGRRFFLFVVKLIPVARELVKKIALVRFSRTLGSLLRSGLSILDALKLSAQAMNNDHYEKAINEAVKEVANGIPVSHTFQSYPKLFPRFFSSLLMVGEKTGTTEDVLKSFSDFYDEDVDNTIKDFTSLLEPVLLLFMGVVIGLVAMAILLPIYQFVGKFT